MKFLRKEWENCQLWALSRKSFKLGYPINAKKSAPFVKYYLLNLYNNKNDRFWRHRKTTKITFFAFRFFYRNHRRKTRKSTFTVKFNPPSSLEVTSFVLIRFPGPSDSLFFSASWPCLDFQHHDCIACWEIARIFDGVGFFPHFFHIYTKSTATLTYYGNFENVKSPERQWVNEEK